MKDIEIGDHFSIRPGPKATTLDRFHCNNYVVVNLGNALIIYMDKQSEISLSARLQHHLGI